MGLPSWGGVHPLRLPVAVLGLSLAAATLDVTGAGAVPSLRNWPRFRGADGSGVAADGARPPVTFGPRTNVAWQVDLPSGNASPILWGDRLFITAQADGALRTLAFDAGTGRELWRRDVVPTRVEEVHPSLGSPASATPVTDGTRVYAYFGSAGLVAFDAATGAEAWRHPLPLTQTEYGASSSPVLVGDLLVQLSDQDGGSFLLAVDKRTGRQAWRVERPEMRRGFGTPLVWEHHGRTDLVVPGTIWLKGLDPRTGDERWQVSGLARITCTSPVLGDGLLFTASWTTGGDRSADRIALPKFDAVLAEHDRDHDGKLSLAELPEGAARQRSKHLDGNRDGFVDRAEWETMADIFARVENQAFAVQPDAQGGVSDAGVRWRFKKGLPYVASPLHYRGRLYLVKNGGMVTCLDPRTGQVYYQEERLGATGDYYASPVAADGRIYFLSQRGVVSVVNAGDRLDLVRQNDLGEAIQASPAIIGPTLYLRTASHLYAFRDGVTR